MDIRKFFDNMKVPVVLVLTIVSMVTANFTEVARENRLLAAKIYKSYANLSESSGENFVLSPFSAQVILALTYFGTQGETAKEFELALNLPANKEDLKKAFKSELSLINKGLNISNLYNLTLANNIFINKQYVINKEFNDVAKEVFNSGVDSVDFSNNTLAAEQINSFVKNNTNNLIQRIIEKEDLSEDTNAVLVNALYFQATWVKKFYKELTIKQKFFLNETYFENIPMMHLTGTFDYYESAELKAKILRLPYEGDVSMTIVLPNEKDGLPAIEENLEKVFEEKQYIYTMVTVALPKFRVATQVDMEPILKSIGIISVFGEKANFKGLINDKELRISKATQKSVIDVNEDGTEAASSTSVEAEDRFGTSGAEVFKVNHPAFYYISKNGSILFMGRIQNPLTLNE